MIDLSRVPHLEPHLPAGFVSHISFFDLFGFAVKVSIFLLIIPLPGGGFGLRFGLGPGLGLTSRFNHSKHLLNL